MYEISAGISAEEPDGDTPAAVTFVEVPTVTYSSSALIVTRSNVFEGTDVDAMIRPEEIERSEPSEGLLMISTLSEPSGREA